MRQALSDLSGVRLGQRERALLLAAPGPDAGVGHGIDGLLRVGDGDRAARVSALRAARRLNDLGLVDYFKQTYSQRGVYVKHTLLGAQVVDRYRSEMENGRPIRWPAAA